MSALAARLAALWLLLSPAWAWAADGIAIPPLAAHVTDLTATLDAGQTATLEQRLADFKARKGGQVVLLMLPTTQPETIEQFGIRLMEAWKVGRRGIDDGAIIIVAKDDRRVRIEVGYGLEGAINDAMAKRIVSERMTPAFKAGDYFGGIGAGIEEILRLAECETLPEPATPPLSVERSSLSLNDIGDNTFLVALALVIALGTALRYFLGNLLGSALVGSATGFVGWLLTGTLLGVGIGALAGIFLAFFGLDLLLAGLSGGGRSSASGGGSFGGGGSGGGGGASGSW